MCVLSTHLSYGNRRLPLQSICTPSAPSAQHKCDDTVVQDRSFRGLPFISLSVSTLTTALQYTTYTNRHPISTASLCHLIPPGPPDARGGLKLRTLTLSLRRQIRLRSLRTRNPPSSHTCKLDLREGASHANKPPMRKKLTLKTKRCSSACAR